MKKRLCLRLLALVLCLLLLPFSALGAKGDSPSDIRVCLRRLNLTDQVWITLTGRYLARAAGGSELLLPENEEVSVFLRDEKLVLFCSGVSFSAGQKLTLLRLREGEDEPGVRFNLQPGFYPGDLSLSVRDGAILPVLTLPLETYLQGVVPYEMSDSFPPEALKAQAVCARTYAISKLDPSADWDVVDTTNDQVFKGLLPENKNTEAAVTDTKGLVLTYRGKLITAWYSASNGGQTELPQHVWGGKNVPACFQMTDDPWDAENPASLTRTAELKKDGSGLSAAFLRLVREALRGEKELDGFRLGEGDVIRVDALRNLSLTSPRYKKPSRLMTKMEFTVDLSAEQKAGSTPVPEGGDAAPETRAEPVLVPAGTFPVTLDLFPGVIGALGLSISGEDNEIVTLAESEDAWTLTSGRFGHGVGMSQRGAQYQAQKDGKTFREILDFYYPGAVLKQYAGEPAPLPTPDPALAHPPGPVPTATPRPTLMPVTGELPEGAWLASVEGIDDDSSLNLRAAPSPGAEILMRIYKHQKLVVLENAEVEGWVKVRTDAAEGYVMFSFLEKAR